MKQNRSMLGYPRSQTVNAFMGSPGRLTLQQWSRVLQNIPKPRVSKRYLLAMIGSSNYPSLTISCIT